MTSPRSLTVHIAGLDLAVRTTASDPEVQRIVQLIESRLSAVKKSAIAQPLHNHLALVTLSLAQELLQAQQDQQQFLADLDTLFGDLLGTLDDDDA